MDCIKLPADYAIDALALETDRRRKTLGRSYSYGQLIADTTLAQREQIAEDYREAMTKGKQKGIYRVKGNGLMPVQGQRELEDAVCEKICASAEIKVEDQ